MRKHRVTIALVFLAGLIGWAVGRLTAPEPEPDPFLEKAAWVSVGMTLAEAEAILGPGRGEGFAGYSHIFRLYPKAWGPIQWTGKSWGLVVWVDGLNIVSVERFRYTPPQPPPWWERVRARLGL